MSNINEKFDQFETNSNLNSNNKYYEEDGSPTDNENNMNTVSNNEIINNDSINNDHNNQNNVEIFEENLSESDKEVDINDLTDNNIDDKVDIDDNMYVQEINHNYDDVVFYNKKYIYKNEENSEETSKLIDELQSLNLCNPKIDVLFKRIFKNKDLLVSLLNSIIPDEEHIDTIEYSSEEIIFIPFMLDQKNKMIVDFYCKELNGNYMSRKNNNTKKESNYKKHIVVEMQIKKKYDIVIRASVEVALCYCRENLDFEKSVYSFNFLFYNYYNDDIYVRDVSSCLPKGIDNKVQNKIYISELRKFRKDLDIEKLKDLSKQVEDNKSKGIVDRKLEKDLKKQLWFAFLSKINVIYKNDREEVNRNNEDNEEGKKRKRKYKIYIRNDISPDLYKLFKKDKDIMKAMDICKRKMNEDDVDKYYRYVSSEEEINDWKNKYSNLENMYANLKKENSNLENKYANLENKYANLENKYANLEKENSNLKNKYANLEKENSNLKNKVIELENQQKIQQDNFMKIQENL